MFCFHRNCRLLFQAKTGSVPIFQHHKGIATEETLIHLSQLQIFYQIEAHQSTVLINTLNSLQKVLNGYGFFLGQSGWMGYFDPRKTFAYLPLIQA